MGPGFFDEVRSVLALPEQEATETGTSFIPGAYPVSAMAVTTMRAVAGAVRALPGRENDEVVIDRGRTDAWFGAQVEPVGWSLPSPWDPLSGAFRTGDGWIRTHANAAHHRAALLHAVGIDQAGPVDRDELDRAIGGRGAIELQEAIVARGGAAAALQPARRWEASLPGRSVRAEPLVAGGGAAPWDGRTDWSPEDERPLAGLRVLDLTRVIAGPACTQVLAGLGADVVRVDPPDWDEPGVLPLVMAGKRSVRLDACTPGGLGQLCTLLSGADVLVHGYRAGALERLGLDAARRAVLRPGLIEVSERAYGWTGPWTGRRGFDSVVQFSTGIAAVEERTGEPVSLPVQALDWATGYLMAAAAIRGVALREATGNGSSWRLSLARTAHALHTLAATATATATATALTTAHAAPPRTDLPTDRVPTPLGDVSVVTSPFSVGAARLQFSGIATSLGADDPEWR